MSDSPNPTFQASAALAPYLRVVFDSNNELAAAGAAEYELGTLLQRCLAADDPAAIMPRQEYGIRKMVAAGAFSAYANLYGAAGGKVDDAPGGVFCGIALEAASGNNSIVDVLYLPDRPFTRRVVEAHTADDTLTAAESGSIHTSVGAGDTVVLTLPAATVGMEFLFRVGAAQELRLDPDGTETIALPSTGVQGAAGKYLTANADGESVHIVCTKAGQWSVFGFTGTWTAEA